MKGFTLLEGVIALGLLSIGLMGVMTAVRLTASGVRHVVSVSTRDRVVAGLITDIQANPKLYRVTNIPVASGGDGQVASIDRQLAVLPIAWSKSFLGRVEDCQACSGRMGYVIQPILGIPGLFQIVIRVQSADIFNGNDAQTHSRDYRFLMALN